MNKRIGLLASVGLMLVLSALLSACSAGQGQGQAQPLTGNDVVQKVREALKNNQSAQGTIELSAKLNKAGLTSLIASVMPGMASGGSGGETGAGVKSRIDMLPDTASVALKVWEQSHDKARIEVDSASLPGVKGATLVYDGKKVYAYVPSQNKVYTKTPGMPGDKTELPAGMTSMLGDWATLTPQQRGDRLIAASDIKVLGSEQVGGKETYKLDITPKAGALEQIGLNPMVQMMAGNIVNGLKATVWVDKASFIPIKATLTHPQIGEFTYSANLALDLPVDPAQFVLQIPAGVETVDLDALREQTQPRSMTLPQARDEVAKAGWKLLEPTYLPPSTTLVEVTRLGTTSGGAKSSAGGNYIEGLTVHTAPIGLSSLTGSDGGYVLKYSSPAADFTITESKSRLDKGLGGTGAKDVTVRGAKATVLSPEGSGLTALAWQESSGVFISIAGKLSLEGLQKIAEGLR